MQQPRRPSNKTRRPPRTSSKNRPPLLRTQTPKSQAFALHGLLHKYVNLPRSKILEIGIGSGSFGNLLGGFVKEYRGIDPDLQSVKAAREFAIHPTKVRYAVGKGEKIPFKGKCNVILCGFSWHYLEHAAALKEFARVLTPNGIIVIIEPTEKTTNWRSSTLRKDSPDFSKEHYLKKMASIKRAQDFLKTQSRFSIVEEILVNNSQTRIYILKRATRPS